MTTVTTKLEIKNWDEKPYRELPDGGKLTRAVVDLAGSEDELRVEATWQALMYYRPDGTSTYVGQMYVTGTLQGRTGSFVLEGTGSYDGTAARNTSMVVKGSGTDALAGLSGTALSVSTHEDYPHWPMTFTYEFG
jgi:hypothetical protein